MIDYTLDKTLTAISGETVTDLHLDFEALSMADLKTAQKIAKMVSDSSGVEAISASPRLDPDFRLGVAWVAAIKGTKGIQVNDVLAISMKDAICLSEVALSEYLF